jgi:hypothetical protein
VDTNVFPSPRSVGPPPLRINLQARLGDLDVLLNDLVREGCRHASEKRVIPEQPCYLRQYYFPHPEPPASLAGEVAEPEMYARTASPTRIAAASPLPAQPFRPQSHAARKSCQISLEEALHDRKTQPLSKFLTRLWQRSDLHKPM